MELVISQRDEPVLLCAVRTTLKRFILSFAIVLIAALAAVAIDFS